MKKIIYFSFSVLLFSACKKELVPTTELSINRSELQKSQAMLDFAFTEHKATPKQTDPKITTLALGATTQFAYLPTNPAVRKDRLFIFIPGTTATPSNYLKIVKVAASQGYYSFGVAYSDLSPIEFYTGSNPKDNTTENILEEYLTGNNTSGRVSVSKANGFENRIIKMILFMDASYPTENWKRFLTVNNEIIWEKLSVAGHSQGSDHAMYMSQKRNLWRAGLFAGPGSFKLNNGNFPSFMQENGVTLRANVFGFNHTKDLIRPWNGVKEAWATLQLPGLPDSIDDGTVNGANQLTTTIATNDGHGCVVSDGSTPNDAGGKPLFANVWTYMCFP